MKKHRKQSVKVLGEKRLVDVPVDAGLYKADNREEYQRRRSKYKHISLDAVFDADFAVNIAESYEEAELLKHLQKEISRLSDYERQIIMLIYFEELTEQEVAAIFNVARQTVNKKKHRIIKKLRGNLIDWF